MGSSTVFGIYLNLTTRKPLSLH